MKGDAMATNRLTRSRNHRVIAGVCGGIAEHYGWSVGLVRVLFLIFGLFGAGEIAYIVLWIVMPKE
jgi:phage shock protein PspC (stress-responsive transcriptional regulator)